MSSITLSVHVNFHKYRTSLAGGNIEKMTFDRNQPVSQIIKLIKENHRSYGKEISKPGALDISNRMRLFVPENIQEQLSAGTLKRGTMRGGTGPSDQTLKRGATNPRKSDLAADPFVEAETDLMGEWLDNDKPLSEYKNIVNDTGVSLMDTNRVLMFQLEGEQKVQKIDIDESQKIQDVVRHCAMHVGLTTDSREYLLSRTRITGILKEKANIDVTFWFLESTAGKHEKLFRKGIKADEAIHWLKASETLRQQGVGNTEILMLRRRYFGFQDELVSGTTEAEASFNPVELQLTYASCERSITSGAQIVKQDKAITLAALELLIRYKDARSITKDVLTKEMVNVLPPEYVGKGKLKKEILKMANDLFEGKKMEKNMENWAKRQYVAFCRELKSYGITFFMVRARPDIRIQKLDAILFGVCKDYVILVFADTKQALGGTHARLELKSIKGWSVSESCILIEFEAPADSKDKHPCLSADGRLSLRTVDGEQIADLLAGYIDLLKQELEKQRLNSIKQQIEDQKPPKPNKGELIKKGGKKIRDALNGKQTGPLSIEQLAAGIKEYCLTRLNGTLDQVIVAEDPIDDETWNQYEGTVTDFNTKIAMLANHWKNEGDNRGPALISCAKNLMKQMEDLITGAKSTTGNEFQPILDLLDPKDADGDLLALMAKLNIHDPVKRRNLFDAVKNLMDQMGNLIKGATTIQEQYEAVQKFLDQAEQEGIDMSRGLPFRMKVMQEAREFVQNPRQVGEYMVEDVNDLHQSLSNTLYQLTEIYAEGGEVNDGRLDDITVDVANLAKQLTVFGFNMDQSKHGKLLDATSDLLMELSKLLEAPDNNASNLNMAKVTEHAGHIRALLPGQQESDSSKALKNFLQQAAYNLQVKVPRMVHGVAGAAKEDLETNEEMQSLMSPAVPFVKNTKKVGEIINTLCTIPELDTEQCFPVELAAGKVNNDYNKFFNKMQSVLCGSTINNHNLLNSASDVTRALQDLLHGIKNFNHEAYQNLLKALNYVHHPRENEEFGDFEDIKEDMITKISAVVNAIPNLEEDPSAVLIVSRNTMQAAEILSHILSTEPGHQQVSIGFVQEVCGIVNKTLAGESCTPEDYDKLTAAITALFQSLRLNDCDELRQQMLDAVDKVVYESNILAGQGLEQEDGDVQYHSEKTAQNAQYMKVQVKLLAPLAEHQNICEIIAKNGYLENIRSHNDQTQPILQNQRDVVETAIQDLEQIMGKFAATVGGDLRVIETQIDEMAQQLEVIKDRIMDEQEDEEVEEADKFHLDMIDDALGISNATKELVAASAALQRTHDRKQGAMGQMRDVYTSGGSFDQGLVSAALEVVKAIGALNEAVSNAAEQEISKEYLICSAQFVAEQCRALEIAAQVQHSSMADLKNLKRLQTASAEIVRLTNNMIQKSEDATHFDESLTDLTQIKDRKYRIKLSGNAWRDELRVREVVNLLNEEIPKLGQKIRNRRKKLKGTVLGVQKEMIKVASRTEQDIMNLTTGENIASNFKSGIDEHTKAELKDKETIKQKEKMLAQAQALLDDYARKREQYDEETYGSGT